MIDIAALSRHGQAAINALPSVMLYNSRQCECSFRTSRTSIIGVDGGTVTQIGGTIFASKSVCIQKLYGIPKPETEIRVQQLDLSYLNFFIEDVLGSEDPTLTEVQIILGPTNR